MAVKFQLRRDTAANWTQNNPILSEGEPGVEIDTLKFKLGDGVNVWTALDYAGGESDFNELLNKPTTLAGYGIVDNLSSLTNDVGYITSADIYSFSVAADDSTSREVFKDETIKFIGGGDISTSSDAEGNITISYTQPTNVSTFTNDSGYITSGDVPTNVSSFLNDSGYITASAIPTNVSSFTNDSGYLTSSVFGSAVSITDTTASTSTSTGALIVSGGVGVAGNLYAAKIGIGTTGTVEVESSTFMIKSSSQIYLKPNSSTNALYQFSDSKLTTLVPVAASGYTDIVSSSVSNAGGGVYDFNCATGLVFRLSGDSIAQNWTTNFTNLSNILSNVQDLTAITIIINQGQIAYMPTSFQIGGSAQTVQWLGGFPPPGNSNQTDVITLLVSATSSGSPILASLATYG